MARVHPCLIALERTVGGYAPAREATLDWFDLNPKRGLAGYGLARALRILLDVLAGLSALESTQTETGQPFVHGELVPAMMRVDRSGTARLIPLAPWHWAEPGRLPASERCGHLAPERLLGDAIDARADVFSAGTLLWEALAGRRLFETDSVDNIVTRLMGDKVTLPQLPPELSWAMPLKAVAMCALSVDPEQRFANCAELAEAITAVAGDQVATHADVADYFGAPDPVTRPSLIVRLPSVATHHSSLSAVVAPSHGPELAELGKSEPGNSDSIGPGRHANRRFWSIAALTCLLAAFGMSAVFRYNAAHDEGHSAARGAPPPGVSLPSATPRPSALPEPTTQLGPSAVPGPADALPPEVQLRVAPSDSSTPPSQSPTGPSPSKGLSPKLRVPAKAGRSPDKTAAKYGI